MNLVSRITSSLNSATFSSFAGKVMQFRAHQNQLVTLLAVATLALMSMATGYVFATLLGRAKKEVGADDTIPKVDHATASMSAPVIASPNSELEALEKVAKEEFRLEFINDACGFDVEGKQDPKNTFASSLGGFLKLQVKEKRTEAPRDSLRELIDDHYIPMKGANFVITEDQRGVIQQLCTEQCQYSNVIPIAGIKHLNTRGDGSCGLHALLGEDEKGVIQCADIQVVRKDFSAWARGSLSKNLEQGFARHVRSQPDDSSKVPGDLFDDWLKNNSVSDWIRAAFSSYFNPGEVRIEQHTGFMTKLTARLNEKFKADFKFCFSDRHTDVIKLNVRLTEEKSTPDEEKGLSLGNPLALIFSAPQLPEMFGPSRPQELSRKDVQKLLVDGEVDPAIAFDIYLEQLQEVGHWLSQDELIAASECFEKTLVLYQRGWGDSSNERCKFVTYKKGKLMEGDELEAIPRRGKRHVYYELGHYSKAQLESVENKYLPN